MATQLGVYQEALEHLGERPLASISEDREPRRAMDSAWNRTVDYCLEQGFWNFAMRSVELEPEPAIEPAFGMQYAYAKPDDWLRTYVVTPNEDFVHVEGFPFFDENNYWIADSSPLYVRYVSDDTDFGWNLTKWPTTFTSYVAVALARRICKRVSNDTSQYEILFKLESRAKLDAMSKDAMNEGPRRPPFGSWVRSRYGGTRDSFWNGRFR